MKPIIGLEMRRVRHLSTHYRVQISILTHFEWRPLFFPDKLASVCYASRAAFTWINQRVRRHCPIKFDKLWIKEEKKCTVRSFFNVNSS